MRIEQERVNKLLATTPMGYTAPDPASAFESIPAFLGMYERTVSGLAELLHGDHFTE